MRLLVTLLAGLSLATQFRATWTVTDKTGTRRPLVLNGCQRILDYEREEAARQGRAALIKCIKIRQSGISLLGCAWLQALAQSVQDYACISIADKLSLPRIWLDRADRWHGETPGAPIRERSNAQELVLDNGSRYVIGSAEGKTPGMGATLAALHCSEIGFWRNPAKVMGDLLPAVPLQNPHALVLLESCGEQEGSWWHGEVLRTLEGEDQFKLVFLPWVLCPEYSRPADGLTPEQYTEQEREAVARAMEWVQRYPLYAALAGFDGRVTPEQLAWRRWMIVNFFGGDVDMYACRYPITIGEAFLGIGSQAIPISILRHHKAEAHEPIAVGRLEWNDKGEVEWVDDEQGAWHVYEAGYEYCEYCIGGDVAEGKVSDPEDERSERDWSTMVVLNRRTLATTATFRARIEPDAYGREMVKAGRFWCDAWVSPEANSAGMAALAVLRDYPHLMAREGTPDQLQDRALDRLGWKTTNQNRNQLIDEWIAVCHPDMRGEYEGRVHCWCPLLAGEERTFVRTGTGKREHRPGCHDDVLFAAMIAYQVHQRCPHIRRSPETVRRGEVLAAVQERLVRDDRFAGGVDLDALSDEPAEGEWRIE